ncbi:hypothetical protein SAMN02990966_07866 [Rhodospirillales bacterium URHD0017]|nr:hypothetical protein SAMN02990966_07866 [Rhodospirillales bacterium URHD0017]
MVIENDRVDTPVNTPGACALLASLGFPYAEASLDRMRCVGGGPRFLKHGARVFYRPSALREWVASRTRELANTSEAA